MGKVHKDIAMFMVNNAKEEGKSDEQLVTVSTTVLQGQSIVHGRAVGRSIIGGGGGGAYIHIFLFTDCKNNRF